MHLRRVRRLPVPGLVECVPSRVRRTRPIVEDAEGAETPVKARVTRTRGVAGGPPKAIARRRARTVVEGPKVVGGMPLFFIRWDGPLSYKFSIYMVTSYLYYHLSRSVITDGEFDQLCKELDAGYDDFEHQHKHLVDRGQFAAGTGYAIKYPLMVRNAATHLLEHHAERC